MQKGCSLSFDGFLIWEIFFFAGQRYKKMRKPLPVALKWKARILDIMLIFIMQKQYPD